MGTINCVDLIICSAGSLTYACIHVRDLNFRIMESANMLCLSHEADVASALVAEATVQTMMEVMSSVAPESKEEPPKKRRKVGGRGRVDQGQGAEYVEEAAVRAYVEKTCECHSSFRSRRSKNRRAGRVSQGSTNSSKDFVENPDHSVRVRDIWGAGIRFAETTLEKRNRD